MRDLLRLAPTRQQSRQEKQGRGGERSGTQNVNGTRDVLSGEIARQRQDLLIGENLEINLAKGSHLFLTVAELPPGEVRIRLGADAAQVPQEPQAPTQD